MPCDRLEQTSNIGMTARIRIAVRTVVLLVVVAAAIVPMLVASVVTTAKTRHACYETLLDVSSTIQST